jgi:hypothetical protein
VSICYGKAYLDAACGSDAGLRHRVEELLAAYARASDVLGPPGPPAAANADAATTNTDAGPETSEPAREVDPEAAGAPTHVSGSGPGFDRGSGLDGDALPPGTALRYFGDYEIRRELGRGGMGVVYEARQVSLNRPVALKMVKAGLLAGDDELRRFQNEAEAVALLDHPGVVPVYEVGEYDGQHYFSMKLVPGGSLVPLMGRYKDDPRAAARLVAEAAEAVAHAHARGILHRDLKPANILVDEQGHPHVTDFGLAKKVESDSELTQSGAILGTPAYMAPEQTTGRRGAVTTAADEYGLGAVLYALLTGKAPFGGDSVMETLDAVRTRPPDPPSRLNAKVPRDLEVICLKCLEKEPARRYRSADALAEDLRRWLDGRPITARPVSPAVRAWMWCRRNKGIAALGALLVASLIAGTVFSLAFAVRARRQRDWSERLRYIAEINLALRDWDAGNAELARSRLADLTPKQPGALDLRGWEWFYLDNAFQPELRVLRGHQGEVGSLVFAPDGRRLASAGEEGMVRIWDLASGRETARLRGGRGGVGSLVFAPDGRQLASGGDGMVQIWDAAPLTPQRRVHREALGLVRFLLERATSLANLRDRIRRDPTISEEVWARAVELANGHWEDRVRHQAEKRADDLVAALFAGGRMRDEVLEAVRAQPGPDPEVRAIALELARTRSIATELNNASWFVTREPGRDPGAYRLALRRAEAAHHDRPDDANILNTLGIAQYRVGLYREALATLMRSNTLNGGRYATDLGFLALAQQSLGQVEQARRTLAQLRAAVKAPPEMTDPEENAMILREAEAVIELDPAFPADPFAP